MKITILGAGGGEVTGSAYLVETKSANVLVDCGLFQGKKKLENYNRLPRKGAINRLDAVILTHAHQDHTGRLPLLTRVDYGGPIYATPATIEFTDLLLRDAAHLQKGDVEQENRKRKRQGQPPLESSYTLEEVDELSPLYRPLEYDQPTEIAPGIVVRVVEAGHIAGSVSIEMTMKKTVKTGGGLLRRPRPARRAAASGPGAVQARRYRVHGNRPMATTTTARCKKLRSRPGRSSAKPSKQRARFWFRYLRWAGRSCCFTCWPGRLSARTLPCFPFTSTARWRLRRPRSTAGTWRYSTRKPWQCSSQAN